MTTIPQVPAPWSPHGNPEHPSRQVADMDNVDRTVSTADMAPRERTTSNLAATVDEPQPIPSTIDQVPALSRAAITIPTRIDKATGQEAGRYAMDRVYVASDGDYGTAWATDGRMLAIVNCKSEGLPAGSHTLPRACLPTVKKQRTVSVELEDGTVSAAYGKNGERLTVETGSRIPSMPDVIPTVDKVSKAHITLTIDNLRKMIDAVANTSPDDPAQEHIHILIGEPNKPAAFLTTDAVGILMPVNTDDDIPAVYDARRRAAVSSWTGSQHELDTMPRAVS